LVYVIQQKGRKAQHFAISLVLHLLAHDHSSANQ
jgi:hypothetical protein